MWSWLPIIGFVAVMVAVMWVAQRFLPLLPVTETTVQREYRLMMLGVWGFLALMGVAAVLEMLKVITK